MTVTIFVLRFICFRMQESPKFLIHKDRDEAALRALRYVCKMNKRECGITSDMLKTLTRDHEAVEMEILASPEAITSSEEFEGRAMMKPKLDLGRFKLLFTDRTTSR